MSESSAPADPFGVRIVHAADAQSREFLGIPFDLLATGDRLMVTRMNYETGMTVAPHAHEHEQAGYVISGRYRQTAAGAVTHLGPQRQLRDRRRHPARPWTSSKAATPRRVHTPARGLPLNRPGGHDQGGLLANHTRT
jgi:hypothetical protein